MEPGIHPPHEVEGLPSRVGTELAVKILSSAESQKDSEGVTKSQVPVDKRTNGASGTVDDEWIWSNGQVFNTATDRDELRHSTSANDSGQVGGSSEQDLTAANLTGTTTTPLSLLPTLNPQQLSKIPMESNSADLNLENNDLLSSDTGNLVSTPVLGSGGDNTVKMLSVETTALSISPDTIPSSLAPEDLAELEYRPPTPMKDDTITRDPVLPVAMATPVTPALLQTLPLPQPPPAPPPKDVPPKDRVYLDPAPRTPGPSRSSSLSPTRGKGRKFPRDPSSGSSSEDDEPGDNTKSEIHNIFEQSNEQSTASLAPPSSLSSPSVRHPVRTSSLSSASGKGLDTAMHPHTASVVATSSPHPASPHISGGSAFVSSLARDTVPQASTTMHQPPPPDEDLPFDFHRFLSQLRHRSADPVAKFLKSFLGEFAKKQWMVHEQVKIVQDFLNFIYGKMEGCEVWRDVGDVEMDNAREGMEKLVMNRLYTQAFSPAIAPPLPPGARGSRRNNREYEDRFPGRRGQHQEDVERDDILAQKVRIYGWIREEHLDIGDTVTGDGGKRFLDLAVGEMVKMGSYRAPRDKVICVLNCCKVIFGEQDGSEQLKGYKR